MTKTTCRVVSFALMVIAVGGSAWALPPGRQPSRFDAVVVFDPSADLGTVAEAPDALAPAGAPAAEWQAFQGSAGGPWKVHLDRRSGSPLLVEGAGLPWYSPEGPMPSIAQLEAKARQFLGAHEALFRVRGAELSLNPVGSAAVDKDRVVLVFDRVVDGIPVDGQRFLMFPSHGSLVSFGAARWGAPDRAPRANRPAESQRPPSSGRRLLG